MSEHDDYVDRFTLWLAFAITLALTPIGIILGDIPRTVLIGGVLSAPALAVITSLRLSRHRRHEGARPPLSASRGRG